MSPLQFLVVEEGRQAYDPGMNENCACSLILVSHGRYYRVSHTMGKKAALVVLLVLELTTDLVF